MRRTLVIIVTFNGMKWIERCLCSVDMSTEKADIVVIDNGSSDGTPEWIEENFGERVKLHRSTENLGFGAANNIGFEYALDGAYEYIYLLNQDAWVRRDCFSKLIDAFEAAAKDERPYGILSPMQMRSDKDFPEEKFLNWYRISDPLEECGIKRTNFVMAAHWMISRACLEKVGAFSPAFRHYGEDDNYIHRAAYHGFLTGLVPAAEGVHDRQDRKIDKGRVMHLKKTAALVKICHPQKTFVLQWVWEILKMGLLSLRHASTDGLKYMRELFAARQNLQQIKKTSLHSGAFLSKKQEN